MAQVSVVIAGRTYRMACGEGEEARLQGLAAAIDAKIADLRQSFGEIGDGRLSIMAALTFADEAADLRGQLEARERDLSLLRAGTDETAADQTAWVEEVSDAVLEAAARVERAAQALNRAS